MRKILILLVSLMFTFTSAFAESINKTLNSLGVDKDTISISVKNIENGNVLYELNEKTQRTPASTLKVITTAASVDTLGNDYKFSTKLYKSTNNDLYIKLSGDPLLTSDDLGILIDGVMAKNIVPKNIYIDDSVFDNNEWGKDWLQEDELNSYVPKFSAYNIDNNLLRIEISPTANLVPANIKVKPFYPISFMNLVETDGHMQNSVKIEKSDNNIPNMLKISGVVSKIYNSYIPVSNPKMNFILRLEEVISDKKLEYYNPIQFAKLPVNNIYLVSQADHSIDLVVAEILKNSSNLASETLFKMAGAVWANSTGTFENSMKMFEAYLKKYDIDNKNIQIADASGISANNLVTADFMTDFLVMKSKSENFEDYKLLFPAPGTGTLKNRMLYFKDNLRAKTGTLSGTSALAGYIVSRSGKVYAFDIMINDPDTSSADKKNIEEQILRNIYVND